MMKVLYFGNGGLRWRKMQIGRGKEQHRLTFIFSFFGQ